MHACVSTMSNAPRHQHEVHFSAEQMHNPERNTFRVAAAKCAAVRDLCTCAHVHNVANLWQPTRCTQIQYHGALALPMTPLSFTFMVATPADA